MFYINLNHTWIYVFYSIYGGVFNIPNRPIHNCASVKKMLLNITHQFTGMIKSEISFYGNQNKHLTNFFDKQVAVWISTRFPKYMFLAQYSIIYFFQSYKWNNSWDNIESKHIYGYFNLLPRQILTVLCQNSTNQKYIIDQFQSQFSRIFCLYIMCQFLLNDDL